MMNKEWNRCPNGHYYQGDGPCPHCFEGNGMRIGNNTIWTPISGTAAGLKKETNIILEFDYAPDGIKRYVEIERKRGDLRLKSNVAGMIACSEKDVPEEICQRITEIDGLVNKELLKKNIFSINTPDRVLSGEWYISEKTICSIVPSTLLTQILGTGSKLDLLYKENKQFHSEIMEAAINTAASASFGDEDFQEARKEIESKKYLSISLANNSKKVLCIPKKAEDLSIKSVEDFVSEDISVFRPTVVVKEYGKMDMEFEYGTERYSNCLNEIANKGRQSVCFKVSRQRVAEVLSSLFTRVSELHKQGIIHCDLKPQNILCLKDGLVPFDGINVKKGEISAGMTTNYCAPEQILTMPVSPATDIYNLGLMLLSVIDGIVYGKTSSYVIPTGGAGVKEVRLLSEPMIYIDYETSNIEKKDGIVFWKSFLEKCLAFDSRNRFPNIESFSNEYNRLLELYPLKGHIEFSPNFGRLALVNNNGNFNAGWFISAE